MTSEEDPTACPPAIEACRPRDVLARLQVAPPYPPERGSSVEVLLQRTGPALAGRAKVVALPASCVVRPLFLLGLAN